LIACALARATGNFFGAAKIAIIPGEDCSHRLTAMLAGDDN
jgi:hypothetical protein